jgi:hypothetical protein
MIRMRSGGSPVTLVTPEDVMIDCSGRTVLKVHGLVVLDHKPIVSEI